MIARRAWAGCFGAFACLGAALFVACSEDDLLQGEELLPDASLRPAPFRERPDGAACDGGACDAGDAAIDAPRVEVPDGAAPPTNTCETARDVGKLGADQGSAVLGADGTCSEWISVRATEDNSGALGSPMKLKVTLTPSGHDFDLYGFVNADKDLRSCTTPAAESTARGTGAVDSVSLTWGEGTVANGSDDSRTVTMLVQSADGPCGADAGWRLRVEGNK